MAVEQQRLQQQGRWTRGAADLMTICGLHRKELAHSAALRWLCDPHCRHGLTTACRSGALA
jgi:hypothetical protein